MKIFIRTSFFFLLLSCYSCSISKKFQTNKDISYEISDYLEKKGKYNDDFLINGLKEDSITYCPTVNGYQWIVPSKGLHENIEINRSNNNVSIETFDNTIYLAFRTGPTHFASTKVKIYIISSKDGKEWEEELLLSYDRDIREPYLIEIDNKLHFYFFTSGTKISSFSPERIHHFEKERDGEWKECTKVLSKGEVHWSMKERNRKVYLVSYKGSHYQLKGESNISLLLKETDDGVNFHPSQDSSIVYIGGVSECGFEFDYSGNLWGVTRLEDGDKSGFGSHVIYAEKDNIWNWEIPETASNKIYMSPKMFNHNNELYLVARRQLGKEPFGKTSEKKSIKKQRLRNWLGYSFTNKTSALFRIDKEERKVEWVLDLPGNGDTAFPSILRISENKYLIANYSSPLKKQRSWISGQLGKTGIYLLLIEFKPCDKN
jgi:hypothetical protein